MHRRSLITGAAALAAMSQLPAHGALFSGAQIAHTPFFYNFTGSNLNKYAAGVAAVNAGTRNAQVLASGDSTTFGYSVLKTQSYPSVLAGLISKMNAAGSMFGDGNVGISTFPVDDTRISVGSGWFSSATMTLGGQFLQCDSPDTGTLSIAVPTATDTYDVYYQTGSGFGTFTLDVGGGVLATVNCNAAGGLSKQTVTFTAGTNTLNIKRTTGGSVFIAEVYGYKSTVKEISVLNAGNSGRKAGDFVATTNAWDSGSRIAAIAPDLSIIMIGINDWVAGTNVSTYQSQVQTQVINCLASGDVILMSPAPSFPSSAPPYVTQAQYVAAINAVSVAQGCGFIDIWNLFGGTFNNAWMSDQFHPSTTGYVQIANAVATALAPGFVSI